MKAGKTKQVRARSVGGDGPFGPATNGGCVVAQGSDSPFTAVDGVHEDVAVGDGSGELEVAVRDGARRVCRADEGRLDVRRKLAAPNDRVVVGVLGGRDERWEPHTTHADFGGVASADEGRGSRDDFGNPRGPVY